eukprot:GHVT01045425.1.p1 GENE.GHVT01045425.1~~GHVT01045425.1.p1  ORF type:complete len:198 (-),score=27.08 GHVT01045425.1:751-1344(-)
MEGEGEVGLDGNGHAPVGGRLPFAIQRYRRPGLDDRQIIRFKEAFDAFDTEDREALNPTAFAHALETAGIALPKKLLLQIINIFDGEGTTQIEFEEFLDMLTAKLAHTAQLEHAEIQTIFHVFKEKGANLITHASLKSIVNSLGIELADEELEYLLTTAGKTAEERGLSSQAFEPFFASLPAAVSSSPSNNFTARLP